MSFDDEIDAARERLKATLAGGEDPAFDELAALQALAPKLEERINSRRLAFLVSDEEDEAIAIAVVHAAMDEVLGHIYAEDGEYIFEAELSDYFEDFVDEDADAFVGRLYDMLKSNLARYEFEAELDGGED